MVYCLHPSVGGYLAAKMLGFSSDLNMELLWLKKH